MILQEKCYQYWPDERVNGTLVSGDLIITLAKVQTRDHYLLTTLHVQHKDVGRVNQMQSLLNRFFAESGFS